MLTGTVTFPEFTGVRCLMMPYIQGDPGSVSDCYASYREILSSVFLTEGDIGFLTIDESRAAKGKPHRGARAKFDRALHTEAGKHPYNKTFKWGWGGGSRVTLDFETKILLANNIDGTCAVWNAIHVDTSLDGDIGDVAADYPYSSAALMKAGEVHQIGILTPHESLPVDSDVDRQFLRIIGNGVQGREDYFTQNLLVPL
jgi:hypothetical protein